MAASRTIYPDFQSTGTGNLIRHIDVKKPEDYRNERVTALIREAIDFAIKDMDKSSKTFGKTISKIKKK